MGQEDLQCLFAFVIDQPQFFEVEFLKHYLKRRTPQIQQPKEPLSGRNQFVDGVRRDEDRKKGDGCGE